MTAHGRLVNEADTLTQKDRKSTRLNSSHSQISYAVFCLKKKKNVVDARRCLSSLTVEQMWNIPDKFQRALVNRILGCNDCLAVCTYDNQATPEDETALRT